MSFKINYKGTPCRGTLFLYVCECGHEQDAVHPASEEPHVPCDECSRPMKKKLVAPALDADLHQRMLTQNIGWRDDI